MGYIMQTIRFLKMAFIRTVTHVFVRRRMKCVNRDVKWGLSTEVEQSAVKAKDAKELGRRVHSGA